MSLTIENVADIRRRFPKTAAEPQLLTLADCLWYYKLEEASGTRADSGPSGHHLTAVNAPSQVTGKVSYGAGFTAASSQRLSIADQSAHRFNADRSLFGWVKLTSKAGAATKAFAGKYSGGAFEWIASYEPTSDRLRFYMARSGGTSVILPANTLGSPSAGVWYFYCVRTLGTTCYLSINAGVNDAQVFSGSYSAVFAPFTIGGLDAGYYHDGHVDEMGMVNGFMPDATMSWLYNSGAGRTLQ